MSTETSGLWWIVALFTGAVGTAMLVYAIRQKDPYILIFGMGISVVPLLVSSGWVAALLSILILGSFFAVRKYL